MAIGQAILGLLDRERYGYEIGRRLREEHGPAWEIDLGQLYRVLRGLEERGWVRRRAVPSTQGPRRWLYRRTVAGRRELVRWLGEPPGEPHAARDDFPLKLALSQALRPSTTAGLLETRRAQLREALVRESDVAASARRGGDAVRVLSAETRRRAAEGALSALEDWSAGPSAAAGLVVLGSDDPLLDLFCESLRQTKISVSTTPVGSLSGLLALRDRRAQIAGVHLLDTASGEYNVPFVRHLFPDDEVVLVRLARREQGLLVAPGNPKNVRGVRDLARRSVRLLNRQRGAGTRLLLGACLHAAGIRPTDVAGWSSAVDTHGEVAAAIEEGRADVGVGLRCAAERHGLDFVPLAEESYDLAVTAETFRTPEFGALHRTLGSPKFRRRAGALPGYALAEMGEVVARTGWAAE